MKITENTGVIWRSGVSSENVARVRSSQRLNMLAMAAADTVARTLDPDSSLHKLSEN